MWTCLAPLHLQFLLPKWSEAMSCIKLKLLFPLGNFEKKKRVLVSFPHSTTPLQQVARSHIFEWLVMCFVNLVQLPPFSAMDMRTCSASPAKRWNQTGYSTNIFMAMWTFTVMLMHTHFKRICFRVTVKLKTITSVINVISNLLIIQIKFFNRIIPNLNLFLTHKSTIIWSTSKIMFSSSSPCTLQAHLILATTLLLHRKKERNTHNPSLGMLTVSIFSQFSTDFHFNFCSILPPTWHSLQ